eukprot:403360430
MNQQDYSRKTLRQTSTSRNQDKSQFNTAAIHINNNTYAQQEQIEFEEFLNLELDDHFKNLGTNQTRRNDQLPHSSQNRIINQKNPTLNHQQDLKSQLNEKCENIKSEKQETNSKIALQIFHGHNFNIDDGFNNYLVYNSDDMQTQEKLQFGIPNKFISQFHNEDDHCTSQVNGQPVYYSVQQQTHAQLLQNIQSDYSGFGSIYQDVAYWEAQQTCQDQDKYVQQSKVSQPLGLPLYDYKSININPLNSNKQGTSLFEYQNSRNQLSQQIANSQQFSPVVENSDHHEFLKNNPLYDPHQSFIQPSVGIGYFNRSNKTDIKYQSNPMNEQSFTSPQKKIQIQQSQLSSIHHDASMILQQNHLPFKGSKNYNNQDEFNQFHNYSSQDQLNTNMSQFKTNQITKDSYIFNNLDSQQFEQQQLQESKIIRPIFNIEQGRNQASQSQQTMTQLSSQQDTKIRLNVVWKAILRKFRKHFSQKFKRSQLGEGYSQWDENQLLRKITLFMNTLQINQIYLNNLQCQATLIHIIFPSKGKRGQIISKFTGQIALELNISSQLLLQVFKQGNRNQVKQFFSDPFITQLWRIYLVDSNKHQTYLTNLNQQFPQQYSTVILQENLIT